MVGRSRSRAVKGSRGRTAKRSRGRAVKRRRGASKKRSTTKRGGKTKRKMNRQQRGGMQELWNWRNWCECSESYPYCVKVPEDPKKKCLKDPKDYGTYDSWGCGTRGHACDYSHPGAMENASRAQLKRDLLVIKHIFEDIDRNKELQLSRYDGRFVPTKPSLLRGWEGGDPVTKEKPMVYAPIGTKDWYPATDILHRAGDDPEADNGHIIPMIKEARLKVSRLDIDVKDNVIKALGGDRSAALEIPVPEGSCCRKAGRGSWTIENITDAIAILDSSSVDT